MSDTSQAAYYDRVWTLGHVWSPQAWPEWSIIAPYLESCPRRLEIGAGLRPRLPVKDTLFAEISPIALDKLRGRGGLPLLASADQLPFPNESLDMVGACEILEHLPDDEPAFAEIGRVLRSGGIFFLSVPMQPALWTRHDDLAGHYRRYEPNALTVQLARYGFQVERFSPGIAGGYARLKSLGAWFLGRFPRAAILLEDRITMPLGARAQKSIRRYETSIPPDSTAPSGFVLCRKQ